MDGRWEVRSHWTGVVVVTDQMVVRSLAHGQIALVHGGSLIEGQKYTIYNGWLEMNDENQGWEMYLRHDSICVLCPDDSEIDIMKVKDSCAGLGGISQGLQCLGFELIAALEKQPLMFKTLETNSTKGVVRGDANNPVDRAEFHQTPFPHRGLLVSGFPCQPLSSQGDGKGELDSRAAVFDSTVKMAWEQQVGAMLLENVIRAKDAKYVQDKIQCLGWSLGMDIIQTVLHLERCWPCRRTRWWMLMVPTHYKVSSIPDIPMDETLQQLDQLIKVWPRWSDDEEDQLRIPAEELAMLNDKRYGTDCRILRSDQPCPCFLHSYGSALGPCPCGCRQQGFSMERLLRDGLRGFYVFSSRDGAPRWLHPAEAALLCGIDPMIKWPTDLKEGLCMVGQCGSALQSGWMGGHLLRMLNHEMDPQAAHTSIKMWLLRQAHGFVPIPKLDYIAVEDPNEDTRIWLPTTGPATIEDLIQAELRLQGPGHKIQAGDQYGPLAKHYNIAGGAIFGHFVMTCATKRQRLTRIFKVIEVIIFELGEKHTVYCATGSFLFEILDRIQTNKWEATCVDEEGTPIQNDERIWEDTIIHLQRQQELFAAGALRREAMGDRQLDRQAINLIVRRNTDISVAWIPSREMTASFHDIDRDDNRDWLFQVRTGLTMGCAAVEGHWILLVLHISDRTLFVNYWDGLDFRAHDDVVDFAKGVRRALSRREHLKTMVISEQCQFQQQHAMTCGTVALLHVGHVLGVWDNYDRPDELEWHRLLLQDPSPCTLWARGWTSKEDELKDQICELLHSHGVSENHSEERFFAALKKIGQQKLATAMESKNQWAALKSLGSQPKVNFLWVKPDELDRQIKSRAESKFRAATSNKKQPGRQRKEAVNVNPKDLELLPGIFVTEDDREVGQIAIEEVASDRSGIAFATLSEVAPFLKSDKSITLDALAVLTNEPVPPADQGLIPVVNLRYPAKYVPTQEAILVEGSLVQLGDCSVLRKAAQQPTKIDPVPTRSYKVTVWKDEWPGNWDQFVQGPVKHLTATCPRLLLCKGDRCGSDCRRYHAPVDSQVDSVMVDVWSRGFFSQKGKRMAPNEADAFQVMVRIPEVCCEGLQQRSGNDGVYFEPRSEDGKSPLAAMAVVWMNGVSKEEVSHKMKITDKGLALARFGNRWGIRTWAKDAEEIHNQLLPDTPFNDVTVQAIYELRPLPHGIQKSGVQSLLREWQWAARPLQPSKGDQHGAGWLVGGKEPPQWLFQTSQGDVLVTVHKKAEQDKHQVVILGSQKTKAHMKAGPKKSSGSAPGKENVIPFDGKDPWGGTNNYQKDQSMAVTARIDQVQTKIQETVQSSIRGEQEERFRKLEVGLAEVKEQNGRFERWFHEAGQCSQEMQRQVTSLSGQVKEQKQELGQMATQIQSGFANIESLLAKSRRMDWQTDTGPRGPAHGVPGRKITSRPWAFATFWFFLVFGVLVPTDSRSIERVSLAEDGNPAAAQMFWHQELPQAKGEFGHRSYLEPKMNSISDGFFTWLQSRQNAEAAQQLEAEEEIPEDDADDPVQRALDIEHGSLDRLQIRRETMEVRLYRPSPGRDRRILLQIRIEPGTSMRIVRSAIFRTWPDLADIRRSWRVSTVHMTYRTSTLVPGDTDCFLVEVDAEIPFDHVVTLNEYQRWRLGLKTFHGALIPKITRRRNDISSFLHYPDQDHRCYAKPCLLRINDEIFSTPQIVDISSGSFMVSADFDRSDQVFDTVGPYHEHDFQDRLPTGYEHLLGLQMHMQTHRPAEDFLLEGIAIQEAIAETYHNLYVTMGCDQIREREVLVIAAEAYHRMDRPQATIHLTYDLGSNFLEGLPQLLEELVAGHLSEDPWSKFFLEPQSAVGTLTMNTNRQVFFMRPWRNQQPRNFILVETLMITNFRQNLMESLGTSIIYSFSPADRDGLLHRSHVDDECQRHECVLVLNDRHVTETGERHLVPDGSVLRIFIWKRSSQSASQTSSHEDIIMEEDDHKMEAEAEKATEPSSRTAPFTPVPGVVGNSMLLATWILAFAQRRGSMGSADLPSPRLMAPNKPCYRKVILLMMCLIPMVNTLRITMHSADLRIGEASHPGPEFWLGTVNPTGVRNKEHVLADLPFGVWNVTETHLSGVNMRQATTAIRRAGSEQGKQLHCLPGAPLPLRARSQTAGTWAGVMVITGLLPRQVNLQWPNREYQMGRVQVTQMWCGPFVITGGCMYGWAKSPTWPNALQDTNSLFDTLVQEIAMSRGGPRYLAGDFNHQLDTLHGWRILQGLGWRDSQELAHELWDQEYLQTCKGRTITDHVLLSPEMIHMMREVRTFEWFADHAALGVKLTVPCVKLEQRVWTLPGAIPWDDIDMPQWQQADHMITSIGVQDLDQRVQKFSESYEASFDGCSISFRTLPNHCRGRGKRVTPEVRESTLPLLKPSRPGEVYMSSDSLGRSVQHWFRQLRRIQSLLHSLRANKETFDARQYRIDLWRAILKAKGFNMDFRSWWKTRPTASAGLDPNLPDQVPDLIYAEAMFHDFEVNYRRFESWHGRQRVKILQAQYCQQSSKIFEVVRKEPKGGINYLEKKQPVEVVACSDDGQTFTLDQDVPVDVPLTISNSGMSTIATRTGPSQVNVEGEWLIQPGTQVDITAHYTMPTAIQSELAAFWKQRWWKDLPQQHEWQRIMDFAQAYLPRGQCEDVPVTVEGWVDINKRYGPRAARGPDGFDRQDLKFMPFDFQQEMVDILNAAEQTCTWPKVWRKGFVHSLPKTEQAVLAGQFRPVIIYSMVYRSWSSYRAKAFLRHLARYATEYQFGFLPEREPAELWMVTQALIEAGLQEQEPYAGFVTDLKKAFESLPREPLKWMARHFGLPIQAINLWFEFLDKTERYFVVQGQTGEAIRSNSGFPEGCALSCTAMVMAGLAMHKYQQVFAGSVLTLSFVDNIEMVSTSAWQLHNAIVTLQTWTDMWGLELDDGKTFVWTTAKTMKPEIARLGWAMEDHASDLGAQMNYSAKRSVVVQRKRLTALEAWWPRLKRCVAPQWQKLQLLYIAFWPKAFYGIATCPLGWGHIKSLRTMVMKAFRWAKAGANSALRLAILNDARVDPGFYQALEVCNTFRRLVKKQPGLLALWHHYMQKYDGKVLQGPFAKLLEICGQLSWQIEAPNVRDRHGTLIPWLDLDDKRFRAILEEGWTWKVWEEVQGRKDMEGLYGIDKPAIREACNRLPPHHRNGIRVLQDGTFVESKIHCKYDLTKTNLCPLCQGQDSLEHRCTDCPAAHDLYLAHQPTLLRWPQWTKAQKLRLLPSANPHLAKFRRQLSTGQGVEKRKSCIVDVTHLHLFTDGSCIGGKIPDYSLGAYSVIQPEADDWLVKGALGGLCQGGDRAELRAIIAAVEIALTTELPCTIWTDSTYGGEGVRRLLIDPLDAPDSTNEEDWKELQGLLIQGRDRITIQHVPGHSTRADNDLDVGDWAARWNDRADREAQAAQRLHGPTMKTFEELWKHHEQVVRDLCALQSLHLDVLERFTVTDEGEEEEHEEGYVDLVDWRVERGCPDSPNPFTDATLACPEARAQMTQTFGLHFTNWMMNWLGTLTEGNDVQMIKLSFLELAIYVLEMGHDDLPRVDPLRPLHWCDKGTVGATEPTVAAVLRLIRAFVHSLETCFCLSFEKIQGLNLVSLGVHTPQAGLAFPVNDVFGSRVRHALVTFTASRPIRLVNDLSRPLRRWIPWCSTVTGNPVASGQTESAREHVMMTLPMLEMKQKHRSWSCLAVIFHRMTANGRHSFFGKRLGVLENWRTKYGELMRIDDRWVSHSPKPFFFLVFLSLCWLTYRHGNKMAVRDCQKSRFERLQANVDDSVIRKNATSFGSSTIESWHWCVDIWQDLKSIQGVLCVCWNSWNLLMAFGLSSNQPTIF